jgi:formylglycine-generating enzyme required for sulfatase activity
MGMQAAIVLATFTTMPLLAAATGATFADPFLNQPTRHGPEMVYIGANQFVMGSDPAEIGYSPDEPRHAVRLSAFSIGKFEVTNQQFCDFLNEEGNRQEEGIPSLLVGRSANCRVERRGGRFRPMAGYAGFPVVTVSWAGARAYCRWLSRRTGRAYHLPSEAQWEDAARSGAGTYWDWGNTFDPARVNCRGKSPSAAAVAIGSFPPNAWGVHDMLGNVWEWVLDAFDPLFYTWSPVVNPVRLDDDSWAPGVRGGSFRDSLEFCRPGNRANVWWWGDYDSIGFRVARREP